jgi:uncharacterized protein (TIGR03437 family)
MPYGLVQINTRIPEAAARGELPIVMEAGGRRSASDVTLFVD